jgi:RNA polymerase sigma-70 factor (ECF subfamily)
MNEAELVRRARRGEEAAFLLLYERFRKGVFGFAYRLLGSQAAAEDIMHDCFASVIANLHRFDSQRASLRTYLYAAARNLARKHLRDPDNASPAEVPEDLETESGPLDDLLGSELRDVVRTAIGRLPPLQREVVLLCEYEELTLAEIAAVVNAEVGTVKTRLHRARSNLRRMLGPYLNGADAQSSEDS